MTTSTEQRLFDIPELLEAILVELPVGDLLRSQAVRKGWKVVVDSLLKLQKALSFVADSTRRVHLHDCEYATAGDNSSKNLT